MTQKILTQVGYDKLKAELKELKEVRLPDIIEKIEQAKELGDLSENAEYHDAKEQQGFMVSRIREIESILKNAILSANKEERDYIDLGSTFKVEDQLGYKKEFTLVGFNEADPIVGRISNESPLGEAFMGKKIGDEVTVEVPKGTIIYKVIDIK